MKVSDKIVQQPAPGAHILAFRGDTRTFALTLPDVKKGEAWLRTNIGHSKTEKEEITREVVYDETPLNREWFDIPMKRIDDQRFELTIALCEVGHFEAKCCFLPDGEPDPEWPVGGNTVINVEPADTCCANIIYNAFVRQFGPNKGGKKPQSPEIRSAISSLESDGYAVIPPSGTFRDLIPELDFIIGELGCRIIMLLPIHPTPTTFARMGRFGSPYAALSFKTVDPSLAQFDPKATPTEQFIELVDAVHKRNAKIFIDIAINHTGWAANLHSSHPEWLVRDKDGRIEAPGAWGVVWEDLTKLDYTHKELWMHMSEVFVLWCRKGVDGFRCDAGYMIPVQAWRYITAVVRRQFPDVVFLLEGLGGEIAVTRKLLNTANLNWAYSELFQNYDRSQIENYLPEAIKISREDGVMIHFAETHDNLRLAERSKQYSQMRTSLCALLSQHGGFGFANGVEWFATERIDVHRANSLNWGAKSNMVDLIRRLTCLLRCHPVFHDQTDLQFVHQGGGNYIALLRHHIPSNKKVLIVVNLDVENPTHVTWDSQPTGFHSDKLLDLISEKEVTVKESGGSASCMLPPGQVLCLSSDLKDIKLFEAVSTGTLNVPKRILKQCFRAKALDVQQYYNGIADIGAFDPEQAADDLAKDPLAFCRKMNSSNAEQRVITWQWPRDIKRQVMIPPDHLLLICAGDPFRAQIVERSKDKISILSQGNSLKCSDESNFVLFLPLSTRSSFCDLDLELTVYTRNGCERSTAHLLLLPKVDDVCVQRHFSRSELLNKPLLLLATNGRGGMLRAHVSWGKLASKYDALLAANLNPDFPEDRWIMFSRCRAWLVFQGYSMEINDHCLDSFCYDENFRGYWKYHIPCGQGQHVYLTIAMEMAQGENAVRVSFYRHTKGDQGSRLADDRQVRIILRPDIEDRNFHETTKAFAGPEKTWPGLIEPYTDGFIFAAARQRQLDIRISKGTFFQEPEWQYMVHHHMEAERGMDPASDLFSPGYFSTRLKGGETISMTAQVKPSTQETSVFWDDLPQDMANPVPKPVPGAQLQQALLPALESFIVKRDKFSTVIAGYPWFLDWGRDTLIFVRGLIAIGKTETAKAILQQFARFEDRGTLPNMIRGDDAGNRDTSDAPLWFFVTCSDLLAKEQSENFLDTDCGGRTIREVLISMAQSLVAGTSNGIKMDPESGLVFSPAHFTWMDTNHPPGTPREGYPIEIQALWNFALSFLARIDETGNKKYWQDKACLVQQSILALFWLEKEGFLSDCLHAISHGPARKAEPDDALRPNQLFAVTMGAVTDEYKCRRIVNACEELLVPGAIRSLADRDVHYPLPVIHHGNTVNHPHRPYQGIYAGDEDSQRKPAYHNGTAWNWVYPSFCEAWFKAYGKGAKKTALALLAGGLLHVNSACVGHIPEILDGDYPHKQRGCDAQAWSVSELLRVLTLIEGDDLSK